MTDIVRCARHPRVETTLTCAKCGTPICPRCMVQAPVGVRCPDCGKAEPLPVFRVTPLYYLRAAGAGLGMAVVAGLLWGVVHRFVPFLYLNFILAPAVGWGIGEVVSLSVGRRLSRWLAAIAGVAVVLAYLVSLSSLFNSRFGLLDLVAVGIGVAVAVSRLR